MYWWLCRNRKWIKASIVILRASETSNLSMLIGNKSIATLAWIVDFRVFVPWTHRASATLWTAAASVHRVPQFFKFFLIRYCSFHCSQTKQVQQCQYMCPSNQGNNCETVPRCYSDGEIFAVGYQDASVTRFTSDQSSMKSRKIPWSAFTGYSAVATTKTTHVKPHWLCRLHWFQLPVFLSLHGENPQNRVAGISMPTYKYIDIRQYINYSVLSAMLLLSPIYIAHAAYSVHVLIDLLFYRW